MNKEQILKHFGGFIFQRNERSDGSQLVFKFENGFGASLIDDVGYGNEIGVLWFDEEGKSHMVYDSCVKIDENLGAALNLNDEKILMILEQIKNIKKEV